MNKNELFELTPGIATGRGNIAKKRFDEIRELVHLTIFFLPPFGKFVPLRLLRSRVGAFRHDPEVSQLQNVLEVKFGDRKCETWKREEVKM
jgi:hypothetical protein